MGVTQNSYIPRAWEVFVGNTLIYSCLKISQLVLNDNYLESLHGRRTKILSTTIDGF